MAMIESSYMIFELWEMSGFRYLIRASRAGAVDVVGRWEGTTQNERVRERGHNPE